MKHSRILTIAFLLTMSQAMIVSMLEESPRKDSPPLEGHDCTMYILKIVADVNQLAETIEHKKWDHVMPIAIDLGGNLLRAYQCFHQDSLYQTIQSIGTSVGHPCPYVRCVKKHLMEAHCAGVKFIRLLILGKSECARKLIPEIAKHLDRATRCGKKE